MSAYTKGPWSFGEDRRGRKRVFAKECEIVRALSTHGERRLSLGERHANARLIAAAPDLLEALKEITYNYMQHVGSEAFSVVQATRAIAKAGGK